MASARVSTFVCSDSATVQPTGKGSRFARVTRDSQANAHLALVHTRVILSTEFCLPRVIPDKTELA